MDPPNLHAYWTYWRHTTRLLPFLRSSSSHLFKPISAGGTDFLLKEPVLIHNSSSHSYSSFEYSSVTLKLKKTSFTLLNIYRTPPPSPYSQPFSTFLIQFCYFLFTALPSHMNSSSLGTSSYMLINFSTVQFYDLLLASVSHNTFLFSLTNVATPLILSSLIPTSL